MLPSFHIQGTGIIITAVSFYPLYLGLENTTADNGYFTCLQHIRPSLDRVPLAVL